MPDEKKRELYAAYSEAGYKIKVYDYPMMQTAGNVRIGDNCIIGAGSVVTKSIPANSIETNIPLL